VTAESGGGGAAPAARVETNGARPVTAADLPEELAAQLPDGFVLPPGFAFVQIPEPTPQEKTAGAAEHADMLRGVYERAMADLEDLREHTAGQLDAQEAGVAAVRDEWLGAEERARGIADEHGIDLGDRPDAAEPGHRDVQDVQDDQDGGQTS
jgi:hypothetical protein